MKSMQAEIERGRAPSSRGARGLAWIRKKGERWPWFNEVTDVSILLVQQVTSTGISAITSVLTARGLGPTGLGLVGLATTVTGMTSTLSSLGLNQTAIRYTSREFAANRPDAAMSILRWALRQRLATVLVLSFIAFLCAPLLANNLWHKPELTNLIRVALPLSVIAALAFVPDVYFQSLRKFHVNAVVRIGESTVSLLGIVALWVFALWTPYAVVIVTTLATGIGALLFLAMVPKLAMWSHSDLSLFRLRSPISIIRYPHELLIQEGDLHVEQPGTFATHLFLQSLLVMTTLRLDYILLGIYRPAYDVGIYSIGTQLAMPLALLTGAITSSLFPKVSAARSSHSLRVLAIRALKMSGVACLGAIIYSLIVPELAPVLLGERYRSSILIGHILCVRGCLTLLAAPLEVVGYGLGLAKSYVRLNIVQLVAVSAINFFYVPHYGAIVPALALIANDGIRVVVIGWLMWRKRAELSGC
jgi:O-antigen/teichoic acid export membrane protein